MNGNAADNRGIVIVPVAGESPLNLYSGSYALLIGESNYTDWPDLENIPKELEQVEELLKSQGFQVTKKLNLDSVKLQQAFEDFINQYGLDADNRLVFFFSGHGHTRKNGDKGYLVPVDAPNPETEERGFVQKAVDMELVTTWARRIESKHALFLFDSCFSGTVFKAKSLPKIPKYIDKAVAKPVREFISAGSADETVPAKSVFTPAFIDALRESRADLNNDGFVTGVELGTYLVGEVPKYTGQTPQFGKIKEYDLAQGDFVFALAGGREQLIQPVQTDALPVPSRPEISQTPSIQPSRDRPDTSQIPPAQPVASPPPPQQVAMIPPPQNQLTSPPAIKPTVDAQEVRTLQLRSPVRSIAISPDGKRLASGNADATIKVFELASGREILSWKGHQDKVLSIAFSPDGRLLASGGSDGATHIWEASTGRLSRSLETYNFGVSAVTFSPDGRILAVSGGSKGVFGAYYPAVKLWDVATGSEIRSMTPNAPAIYALAFSTDGQTLASSQGNTITLWKVSTGEEIAKLAGHTYDVRSIAFSPDGRLLASGSDDKTIKLWNVTNTQEVKVNTLKGHNSPIWSVKFSPDGRWLVSSSGERFMSKNGDYMVKLWNASTGREIHSFQGHEGAISTVFFSQDGQTIASGSEDSTVKLWQMPSMQQR